MKQIYGALSPFDHKKVCYTWQELRDEIKKSRLNKSSSDSEEYSIEEYQLRFRQTKCVVLRKDLMDRVEKTFPNWFNEIPTVEEMTSWNDVIPANTEQNQKEGKTFRIFTIDVRDKKQRDLYAEQQRPYKMYKAVEMVYDCSKVGHYFVGIFSSGYMALVDKKTSKRDSIKPKIFHSTMGKIGEWHIKLVTELEKLLELAKKRPQIKSIMKPDAIGEDRAVIVINNKVSKEQVINFIEEEWPNISKNISRLAINETDALIPSTQDLRIVELRDSLDMSFKEIATKIINEFKLDDPEAQTNEDSVKTAYYRIHQRLIRLIPER